MKQALGLSVAVMALLGEVDAVTLQKKHGKAPKQKYELTAMSDYDDEDNSDQYMAESLKEAEKEVAAANGHEPDLGGEIKRLTEESMPTKAPNEEPFLTDLEKKQVKRDSEDIVADALVTSSKLSFDGSEVGVNNISNGASTEEQKAL